ncbi:MAG: ComEA family DNA-binding protein [Pseudomonas sp.]|nr:ComEA family DNA-binding protein [Pseudomonas sp.]
MRKNLLTALLLPLIASLSFTVNASPTNATTMVEPMAMVDLNSADALTLQKELNGIGKAKAEAIVAYREAHGPFASVDELLEIKGIGNALLERNRDKLKVQ